MSSQNQQQRTVVVFKQTLVAGVYLLIALAMLYLAYWNYQNPVIENVMWGLSGIEVVLVGVALVAVYYAIKTSPLKR